MLKFDNVSLSMFIFSFNILINKERQLESTI